MRPNLQSHTIILYLICVYALGSTDFLGTLHLGVKEIPSCKIAMQCCQSYQINTSFE